jgi:uncharacterized protein (DUF927 family)
MKEILKRYSMALLFLFVVIALMILGTLGVKSFGENMFEGTGIDMHPRGEKVN